MNALKNLLLALTAVSSVTAINVNIECPLICPDSYEPTCATDGSVYAEFDNPCALSVFNCKRQRATLPTYTETEYDWCQTTELDEFDTNFQTNLDESDPVCFRPCPMIYRPICGSNGTFRKVFSNECEMDVFNCIYATKSRNNWKILRRGTCTNNAQEEW